MSDAAMFTSAKDALQFIMSGRAFFTIVSKKTGQRFTYKVERSYKDVREEKPDLGFRWVKLLTGSDNDESYSFIGTLKDSRYTHSRKSRVSEYAKGVVALNWVIKWLAEGEIKSDSLEIWHEGRCGKCARRLTVPASIANGIGPECAKSVYRCA